MAVLVTGGAGYIGSHMVLSLSDAGENVVVLDNLVTGFDWAIDGRALFEQGDAGDIDFVVGLIKKHGITEIVHFAGSIVVPESVTNPLKYYGNNTATSRNLIEAAVKGGVKHFIFSSTAAVYGMTGLAPVVETTPLNPMSPYGRSKLMTEMMLADVAAAHPMTFGVLRYFNVAGADPQGRSGQSSPEATHLIKVACQTALGQREKMDIFGTDFETPDGTGVRDYIHVSDLIAAHALLLKHLRGGGDSTTLNCAYGQGYSVREVVETVRKVSGVDLRAEEGPRRAGDPASITATGEKVRATLGWVPQHADLTEIVQSAFAWEKHLMVRNR
ncbi:UDP-glucose 4-epimerase GalE [Devosia sp. J2-20]|jgi:UDP-glucose 4-epimerase|uniref:UDP-glucose 4-epimerase GalE n=1 Tax=Devosia TaxID=46913 RepID=UPI0022AF5C2B|nr:MULTISPECIES: UDP-glucose 4-epimerase GalE [Devosia]MCZ4346510.1 UDP-glucose 4-epimerase GalE [Devosia neptuniae]WDQ99734.1 UDP-glucose 4-epimerase GalE [Devosia sp. J2-20]|tara:strand:- start:10047 stop:11033 length:987 start_codon:yes stop_codon:yes gene_type:complete